MKLPMSPMGFSPAGFVVPAAVAGQQVKEPGCFVAGTLVHTKDGLRPIEQIKVGDYVLSKPESGEGEQSYQRVTQTYEYEDREVYFAAWAVENPKVAIDDWEHGYTVVTGAHPFMVRYLIDRNDGSVHEMNAWLSIEEMIRIDRKRAKESEEGDGFRFFIELASHRVADLWKFVPVLQHREPEWGVGFTRDPKDWDLRGPGIHFTAGGPVAIREGYGLFVERSLREDDAIEYDYDDEDSLVTQSTGFLPMRRKVYNIEVENTHTYFVGEMGVWVHNISGIAEETLTRNPVQNAGVHMQQTAERLSTRS